MSAGLLEGRVALITGGASGQGRAASVLFAEHGARVVVADIDDDGAGETIVRVDEAGSSGMAVHADISRRADCDAMVQAAIGHFGRLDILYNNAAVQMSGRLVDTSEDDWDLTIATNLDAVFWACRAALPHLIETGNASIISTASVLGLIGSEGYAAYGPAKAGLVALDAPDRDRVRPRGAGERHRARLDRHAPVPQGGRDDARATSCRGSSGTIPLHRLGTAEDVAGIALFLASDLSAYTTGAVIPADGGLAAFR